MYRIFCCRTRKTSKVEVDDITDSIEKCLSVDQGFLKFSSFLISKNFQAEGTALAFYQKSQTILKDLSNLSPNEEQTQIPEKIQRDITNLCEMAEKINFDLHQMNTLSMLRSADVTIGRKMCILQEAGEWVVDLLRGVYNVFKREALRGV